VLGSPDLVDPQSNSSRLLSKIQYAQYFLRAKSCPICCSILSNLRTSDTRTQPSDAESISWSVEACNSAGAQVGSPRLSPNQGPRRLPDPLSANLDVNNNLQPQPSRFASNLKKPQVTFEAPPIIIYQPPSNQISLAHVSRFIGQGASANAMGQCWPRAAAA
jgi:hypothetical protein